MVRVIISVRELGGLKPEYSLEFGLPAVPAVGSYISIQRPDAPEPYGEDLVVRHVWWRLKHPDTGDGTTEIEMTMGSLTEIFVECDTAIGPYSSEQWRKRAEVAKAKGLVVEQIQVDRRLT